MMLFKKGRLNEFKGSIALQAKLKKINNPNEIKDRKVFIKKPHGKAIFVTILIIAIAAMIEIFTDIEFSFKFLTVTKIIAILTILIIIIWIVYRKIKYNEPILKFQGEEEAARRRIGFILEKEKKFKNELTLLFKKLLGLIKKHPEKTKTKRLHEEIKTILSSPTKDYNEIKKVLKVIDKLFVKLPKEEIKIFADSDEAEIYARLLKRYGVR